jgi:hypothetical protein
LSACVGLNRLLW